MDVLASGPDRPVRTRRGPGLRLRPPVGRRPSRHGRRAIAVVGVLLTVCAAVALRSAAEPVEQRPAAKSPRAVPAPEGFGAGLPGPPYDRLPGRTPIPRPTRLAGDELLRGGLPAVGSAGPQAATVSAELVLGRYCRRPAKYAVTVEGGSGWRRLRALAVRIDRSSDPPWVVLELVWTGRAYSWTGRSVQLSNC